VSGRLDEFETRPVNRAASASITREDIETRRPVDAWQLLLDATSVRVTPFAGGAYVMSARGKRPTLTGDPTAPCLMNVVVDGTPLVPRGDNGVDLNDLRAPMRSTASNRMPARRGFRCSMAAAESGAD
jgi:hypothetical protein